MAAGEPLAKGERDVCPEERLRSLNLADKRLSVLGGFGTAVLFLAIVATGFRIPRNPTNLEFNSTRANTMTVYVGIAKPGSDQLAAASVAQLEGLGWNLSLYMVIDGKAAPFSMQLFDSREEAIARACDILKTKPGELVQIDDASVNEYIVKNANNRCSASDLQEPQ